MKKLAKKSSDEDERPNGEDFIDNWSKHFTVQLQKHNAKVISTTLSSLTGDNKCNLYATQYFSYELTICMPLHTVAVSKVISSFKIFLAILVREH